jgi:NADPH-dependent glutamate synthase beta subunit-like oxidoreductase
LSVLQREDYCRRGLEDEPVSINQLKRFVADWEINRNQRLPIPCAPDTGKKVAVMYGGNSAIDCVRTLLRLGSEEVWILYRRTRNEMPANEVEIVAAEHEGVKFQFLAAPTRVIKDDQGRVKGIEYLQMELGEPDASGRRRPVPIEGSETTIELDMLISAISQQPYLDFLDKEPNKEKIAITRWSTFDNDAETLQCSLPYLFTGGDVATGPSLVVDAIGGGRRAARSIHQYLSGEEVQGSPKSLRKKHIPESLFKTVPGIEKKQRTPMPELEVSERIDSMIEVDQVISEKDAAYESRRCLKCCRLCFNPDANTDAA